MRTVPQLSEVLIVGSSHSGFRGDFRSRLFLGRRAAGAFTGWQVSVIPAEGLTGDIRFMGLAIGPMGLLAVAGSKDRSFLATFDKGLKQTGWHELQGVGDPHGIVQQEAFLWVVSSADNSVLRYALLPDGPHATGDVSVFPGAEPQHLNGIALRGGGALVCAFGVSAAGARSLSHTGHLFDLAAGKYLEQGLDQPHGPYIDDGTLLFCESQRSLVWRNGSPWIALDGYLRGLTVAPDGIIHIARSTPRPPAASMPLDRADAAIWSLAPDGRRLGCKVLTGVGPEIYDLIALPNEWAEAIRAPAGVAPPL